MNRKLRLGLAALTLSAAGCASTETAPVEAPAAPAACDAAPAQSLVGQPASVALGVEVQRITGARTLRWLPPRTAVTMEYRADRVGVRYDDAMTVTGISCG